MRRIATVAALPLPCFSFWLAATRRAAICGALLVGAFRGPRAAGAAPLHSTAELRGVGLWAMREAHPVQLEGTLTWIDRDRRLLVLQDASGAIALQVAPELLNFPPGHRIAVTAADSWPALPSIPNFPWRPTGQELLTAFEGPTNWRSNYIARVRGFIYPPTTGEYRFGIASDDTSELWLGTSDDPTSARPIASVATWITRPREWNHVASQQSQPIVLEAGRRYYIEAVHEQRWAADHLSVSWQGPNIAPQVIPGRDLSPWVEPGTNANPPSRGHVLREYWQDHGVESASLLTAPRPLASVLMLAQASIRDLGAAPAVAPRSIHPGEAAGPEGNFIWAEMEGSVAFVAHRDNTLVLELTDANRHTRAVVQNWRGEAPPRLDGRRIRLRGIAEAALDEKGERVLGLLWVPTAEKIPVVEDSQRASDARRVTIAELLSTDLNAARDRAVKLRGRVVEATAGHLTLSDAGSFYGSVSTDGTNWKPLGPSIEIAMGETVEVGLVVSSRSTENISTAVFDRLEGLAGIEQTTVGNPARPGELSVRDGTYTLRGSGHEIWISPDQFVFAHRRLTGAGEIVARIAQFDAADPWAKAGLMIRESLAADAQFVDLVQTGANGCCLQWRKIADGSAPLSAAESKLRAPHWLKLARRFATIGIRGERVAGFAPGTLVEAIGYVTGENGQIVVDDASCRELSAEGEKPPGAVEARPLVELANALSPSGNADRYDIFKTRGVVTFAGEVGGRAYVAVQDRSGAAFIATDTIPRRPRVRTGQFLEIHSNPGWTAPSPNVTATNVFVLGEGLPPPPLRHPAEYSLPRRGEATWIEVEGIVRAVLPSGLAELQEKGDVFSVAVTGAAPEALQRFVDGRVRMRGAIAFPSANERLLLVPSLEQVELVEAPPPQPFAGPVQPIGQFTPAVLLNHSMHRVKVKGIVTLVDRGALYLQDATGGARIELAAAASAQVGDEVEIAGFPQLAEDRSLILSGALLRHQRADLALAPVPASADAILSGRLGARLVRIEAVVSRVRTNESDATFELQLDQRIFRASLNGPTKDLPSAPAGSVLALTGVCVLETALPDWIKVSAGSASILPVHLLLRSASDVVVLQKPRWWAVKRTLLATSVVALALVVAFVWINILRRRVAQRTAELRAAMEKLQLETQTAATLAERNRLAGEIHDSLEQGFSGLILQLDTTAKHGQCPPEVRNGLALARNMVAFSRDEVRHAVWDLHSAVLENADLRTALQKIVEQLAPETPHTTLSVEGDVRPLGSAIEHHLLRIAQEAVTNCVKHAAAQNLDIVLHYGEREVRLSIRDDGRGFVPARVLAGGGVGHFGLRSLRGRAGKIQGTLDIHSEPGRGTTITVRVAVPAPASGLAPTPLS